MRERRRATKALEWATWRALVGAIALLFATATAAGAAPRQSDPAYGSSGPPPPEEVQATCSVSPSTVSAGEAVTGHIDGAPANADVTVAFDGDEVASGQTDAQGSASISFTVPSSPSGVDPHHVSFSGAGFSCTTEVGFVLAETVTPSAGNTKGSASGGLAFTGAQIGLLVVIALVLLVVGGELMRRSRSRRRRIERRATSSLSAR